MYVSSTDKVADVSVPSISLSDHYPISFTRTTSKHSVKRQEHQTIHYRCYKRFNEDNFLNELSDSLNTFSISQTDSNHNLESISQILINVLNHHAPLRSKRVKRDKQPDWINEDIKEAGRNRHINHKLKNWKLYKFWQNKTNAPIRSPKTDISQNQLQKIKKIHICGSILKTSVARHLLLNFQMN